MRLLNKVTLPHTSGHAPSMAAFNGNIYMAWTGADGKLNIGQIIIENNNIILGGLFTLSEVSAYSPTLAVFHGQLYMAWAGKTGGKIHIAPVEIDATDSSISLGTVIDIYNSSPVYIKNTDLGNTAGPVLFAMTQYNAPALCVVWKNTADQINILRSADGSKFMGPGDLGSSLIVFVNANSTLGPVTSNHMAACCTGGNIAWSHSKTNKLYSGHIALGTANSLASIYNYNNTIYNYQEEFFNGSTSSCPAIACKGTSADAGLLISWKGEGSDDHLYLVSVYPKKSKPIPPTEATRLDETTRHSPAMCLYNESVFIVWIDADDHQINMALVAV